MGSMMGGFLEWFKERFPLAAVFSAFLIYTLVASLSKSIDQVLTLRDVISAVAVTCLFLLLRILDEHKDDAYDQRVHPERVLQRGLIKLSDLRKMGYFSLLFMLAVSWNTGLPSLLSLLIMLVWVWLMYKEFFVEDWLKEHLLIYGISHSLVLFFLSLWIVTLSVPVVILNNQLFALMVFIFLFAMGYELTRKAKGRDEVKAGEQSYTEVMSPSTVAVMIFSVALTALMLHIYLMLGLQGEYPLYAWVMSGANGVFLLFSLFKYIQKTDCKSRKLNEIAMASLTFWSYATLIFATHGLTL